MKRIISCCLLLLACVSLCAQKRVVACDGHVVAHGLRFDPNHVTDDMPEALKELLRAYKEKPRYANRVKGKAVAPLLRSRRHQEEPFNRSCPYYTYDNGKVSTERTISGCVATSIEQVLTYYRYPAALLDTLHGWKTSHYELTDVMPGTQIDWDNILDDYSQGYTDQQAQAIADLSLYCGMAVHMNYGVNSSSADLGRGAEPLWRVFGFKTVRYLSRAMYSTPTWNAMLRHELENGRPICYTGHNMAMGGHAFNIDGVDENGYYHLNWSYDGMYDGYFDLDYLNPFEHGYDATEMGRNEGFFSNQTAMFLHPEEVDVVVDDTLSHADAFAGVVVENIQFRRQPDKQGYVVADLSITNTTKDSLNFTFELLTYLPTDTAIFRQADYVGLSAVNLAPGEHRTWPVYCNFSKIGERIFGFSADDETIPYTMNITIENGTAPNLRFGEIEHRLLRDGDMLMADFTIDITNEAATGWSGDLVTYCLFPEGSDVDYRHWEVLNLAGGDTYHSTVRFQHLEDGKTYTLKVRSPWDIRQEVTFTVRKEDATDGIWDLSENFKSQIPDVLYDLQGRQLPSSHIKKGIYIKNGKKYFYHNGR